MDRSNPNNRIPQSLQAVFLASNRGNDVHKPPPNQAAFKVYGRWQPWKKLKQTAQRLRLFASTRRMKKSKKRSQRKDNKTSDASSVISINRSSKVQFAPLATEVSSESPQEYLDRLLVSRGYSVQRYNTLDHACVKPSPLQQASYDVYLLGLVRTGRIAEFSTCIAAGLSPNPCNMRGESLVHMVARRGEADFFSCLVGRHGASLKVTDDYGRTVLHDACWAAKPAWGIVRAILEEHSFLLHLKDARGHVPLDYVRKEHWFEWTKFLERVSDDYWPAKKSTGSRPTLPPMNKNPLPDPPLALCLSLARMVASGRLAPEEAVYMNGQQDDTEDVTEEDDDDDEEEEEEKVEQDDDDCEEESEDESIDDDDVSSYDSSEDDESELTEDEEMEELLRSLPAVYVPKDSDQY